MARIAFCAALYEAGRPYLPDFLAGIRAAARGHEACLIAAIDDLVRPRYAFSDLQGEVPVELAQAPARSSPAAVRRLMLGTALRSGADVLVFSDMDDVLLADAADLHLAALEDAAFSYGDLCLMDAAGDDLHQRFYDGAGVPQAVASGDAILRRSFLGLSNTAIRADRMTVAALQVPDDIAAVDWWLFATLLQAGRRGARTAAPVARYRLYQSNALGAGVPASPDALRRTYAIMQRHYQAFRAARGVAVRLAIIEDQMARLALASPGAVAARLASMRDQPGVWYEGLDDFAFDSAAEVATAV
jgi:hypothetical protein